MDVRTLMRRAAQFHARREAVVHGARRISFAEAWQRGVRMANGLIALGLKPGDRVGVLEDNALEASDIFTGAAIANTVRVPLYPRNSAEAHTHMLGHTNCKVVVVSANYAHEIEAIRPQLPDLKHVIVRDAGYEAWLQSQSAIDPDPPIAEDDNYIIRHTGGTTGKSKGVAYTHRGWVAALRDWFFFYPTVEPGDRCLHLGPISHGSGYLFTPIWLAGGCNVMIDKFEPGAVLDLMEKEKIAYMFTVPTMVNMMLRDPRIKQRDFSSLKCMPVTAAPIADDTALKAYEVWGNALHQGYGQTEVLPVAMMSAAQWFAKDVPGSNPLRACGVATPFAELQIWDENNKPVPLGQSGQIVAKADGQMAGFWNDPVATRERIVDGWVLTGDVGMLDHNGYLYMLDRANDMVVSGGFNIYPAELENAIADHPAVIEVAVFGVPHDKWGEVPIAVCTVDAKLKVSEDEIIALCVDKLGSYKKPHRVEFRHEPLPKTPVGKIKRKELREPFWQGHTRRVAGS